MKIGTPEYYQRLDSMARRRHAIISRPELPELDPGTVTSLMSVGGDTRVEVVERVEGDVLDYRVRLLEGLEKDSVWRTSRGSLRAGQP